MTIKRNTMTAFSNVIVSMKWIIAFILPLAFFGYINILVSSLVLKFAID